jgi:hypothetical protein
MFARPTRRTVEVLTALAVWPSGEERPVPSRYIANDEPMLALSTLRKGIAAGRRARRALCDHVAARLREQADSEYVGAERIVIATRTLDAIAHLAGRAEPEAERVHVRCRVEPRSDR